MQLRFPFALIIFIGSYLPLSLILLAQDFDWRYVDEPVCWTLWSDGCVIPLANASYSVGAVVLCLVCLVVALITLAVVRPKRRIAIHEAEYVPSELISYTLPYVVAFMGMTYSETHKLVGLTIFLSWMFWLTHRSGQIILNPVLIAFGWRPYKISYSYRGETNQRKGIALANYYLVAGKEVEQVGVQNVLITKRDRGALEDA